MSSETVKVNVADLQSLFGGTDNLNRCFLDFAKKGNLAGMRLTLAAGADVNAATWAGESAVHLVAQYGYDQALILLHEAGADLDTKAPGELNSAHLAARYNQITILRLLDKCGATLNGRDYKNDTPEDWARTYDHAEAADLIKTALLRRAEEEQHSLPSIHQPAAAFAGAAVMPKDAKRAPISRREALII